MSERVTGIAAWQGLNATKSPALLPPGECAEMSNVHTGSGSVERRPGFRLVSVEEVTDAVWPSYLPPVQTPATTPGVFFNIDLPEIAVEGDAFPLRIEAQDRAGSPIAAYADEAALTLAVQADSGGGWGAFAGLALAAGGAVDPTVGWSAGVWQQDVIIADLDSNTSLRVQLSEDAVLRAEDTCTLLELDSIVVDLPPAITPDVPFLIELQALDATAATLLEYAGTDLELVFLGDDAVTELTVVDEDGEALDLESGWSDGRWSVLAVLADPEDQTGFTLTAERDSTELGDQDADISQLWQVNAPTTLQAYQQATWKIRARTAAAADWDDYDGTNAAWTIELRALDGTWAAYTGLTDENGDPLDVTAGWTDGIWEQTVQFAVAAGNAIRVTYSSYDIEQWVWQLDVWPVANGSITAPIACAAATAFDVSLLLLDERGYLLQDYAGALLSLTAVDEADDAVSLTDEASAALDLTTGWEDGRWTGQVMFAATGLSSLTLSLVWNSTTLATATLIVGTAAPGVATTIDLWAPPAINPGTTSFPMILVARDSLGNLVDDYDGDGLALAATGEDDETGDDDVTLTLAHDALDSGWENGALLLDGTLADPVACERMNIVASIDSVAAGSVEVYIAMTFVMTVPETVQEDNTYTLSILAVNPDGSPATSYLGEDLELAVYESSGGSWIAAAIGTIHLTDEAAWNSGRFAQTLDAPAEGTYKFVLSHQDEDETTDTMQVTENLLEETDLPDDDDEDEDPVAAVDISLPGTVWPGCLFAIGASADIIGSIGTPSGFTMDGYGTSLSLSPAVTPAADIDAGWTGMSWGHSCRLADPTATGNLTAEVSTVPAVIPEEMEPSDFVDTAAAAIGEPDFSVALPATMHTGTIYALLIQITGNGSRLTTYNGDGFTMRVETYDGTTWTTDATALLEAGGGAIPTTWSNGRISARIKLGATAGTAQQVRLTAVFNGSDAASDTADVVSVWEATLSGVTYLHPLLPTNTLTLTVDTYGETFDPALVTIAVEGLSFGTWSAFANLRDSGGVAIDWAGGWSGTTFVELLTITGAANCSAVRIRVSHISGGVIGELQFDVADDMEADLTVPSTVYQDIEFSLTIDLKDGRDNLLTLYDGDAAEIIGTCLGAETVGLTVDDVTTGWSGGQWTGNATLDAAAASYRIAFYEASEILGWTDFAITSIASAGKVAIYQRQVAMSLSAGSRIDPEAELTLAQCCTAGNLFTTGLPGGTTWVAAASNSWDGGGSPPTTRSADANYFGITASGATVEVADFTELHTAVVAFQRLAASVGTVGSDAESYEGDSGVGIADEATAKSDAAADWQSVAPASTIPEAKTYLANPSVGSWRAKMTMTRIKTNIDLRVGTEIGRRIRIYALSAATSNWDDHDFDVADGSYDTYTDKTHTDSDDNIGEYPRSTAILSDWPSLGPPSDSDYKGFASSAAFALCDPEFTH
jgi:hypothetical protein